jgi:hypothetical protein
MTKHAALAFTKVLLQTADYLAPTALVLITNFFSWNLRVG